MQCYLVCLTFLDSSVLPGFHSSSPVCEAAVQHLCPWVHGHRLWVRGLRLTSSHCQVGQEWRRCHPQWLLQNNCKFIRHKSFSFFPHWTHCTISITCMILHHHSILTAFSFSFFPFLFCRRSTTCRFWVWSSQMRVSTSALQRTMQATFSPAHSLSS